mgnify:FL=1
MAGQEVSKEELFDRLNQKITDYNRYAKVVLANGASNEGLVELSEKIGAIKELCDILGIPIKQTIKGWVTA